MPEQVFSPAFPAWRSFGPSPVGWPPGRGDPQPTRSHPLVPRSSAGDPLEERLGETHSEPIYDLIQKDKNPQHPQHNCEAVLHGTALLTVLAALPAPRRCSPHTAAAEEALLSKQHLQAQRALPAPGDGALPRPACRCSALPGGRQEHRHGGTGGGWNRRSCSFPPVCVWLS